MEHGPRIALERPASEGGKEQTPPSDYCGAHLYGQCADMDPILEAAGAFGVPVLEDAAEALGATYKGRPAGTLGKVAAFSFNGNKIITTAGGGMLASRDPKLVDKARFWSTQARDAGIATNIPRWATTTA